MDSSFKSQSIKYETLIKDVTKKISELESIGIDMKTEKDRLTAIKNEINKKKETRESECEFIDNSKKMSNSLYSKKIEELESLINDIKEKYECYYISSKQSSYVQNRLNDEDIDINYLVDMSCELLDRVGLMPTDEFKLQEPIINSIYEAIYNVMKLVSLTSNYYTSSIILSKVNESVIHSFYISNLIEEECKISQNKQVFDKYSQLKTTSMNNNVIIDNELLRLLALNTDQNYITNLKEKVLKDIEDYKNTIQELKSAAKKLDSSSKKYNEDSKEVRKDYIELLKRISFILASIGAAGIISTFLVKGLKKETDLYNTHTIEYNMQNGESKDSYSWETKTKHNAVLEEEEPWEYNEKENEYYKKFNKYSFDSLPDEEDLNNYLKMINENNLFDSDTQTTEEKPDNYGNEQNKYNLIIKEYTGEHKGTTGDLFFYGIFIITPIAIVISMISLLTYFMIFKLKISEELDIGIIDDYKTDRDEKKVSKKEMIEDIKKLHILINKCNILLNKINNSTYSTIYPETKELLNEVDILLNEINIKSLLDKYAPNVDKNKVLSLKYYNNK